MPNESDEHVARGRALGVSAPEDTAAIEGLVAAGDLVRLQDSTRYWVVRDLDQSLPYVTPEKKRALEQLGDRFHARLREADLPPFRYEISSVLRTAELQPGRLRQRLDALAEARLDSLGNAYSDHLKGELGPCSR